MAGRSGIPTGFFRPRASTRGGGVTKIGFARPRFRRSRRGINQAARMRSPLKRITRLSNLDDLI